MKDSCFSYFHLLKEEFETYIEVETMPQNWPIVCVRVCVYVFDWNVNIKMTVTYPYSSRTI